MILKLLHFKNDIIISPDWISVCEIANKKLFSKYVSIIFNKLNGQNSIEDDIYLFDGDKEIKFNDVLYISDPLQIDFNSKQIVIGIVKKLDNYLNVDLELCQKIQENHSQILRELQLLLNDFELEFDYQRDFDLGKYLKMIGIQIDKDSIENSFEKVMLIINIVGELRFCKLIVFNNLKSYLTVDELESVYKQAIYKKVSICLFESNVCDHINWY